MEEKISVKITKEELFDFLLYHTYSKFAGFLTNVLGAAVGIMGVILMITGKIDVLQLVFYLIGSAAFLSFTPLQLRYRARKQVELNPQYQVVWEYTFGEGGIDVHHGEQAEHYDWKQIERSVTTPKTIGIYYGKDQALIIPKQSFGDRFVPIMQMIASQIGPQNVKLR